MNKALLIFALMCLSFTAHAQTNPPAGSNLANVAASSWTNTTGTLTTTGIADTIGGTNAGRLSNSSSQGTTYVIHSLSQNVAVGDVFMAGVWTRLNSGSTGTGFPGTITLASCTNTLAATGYASTPALPVPSTTSSFQWTSVAVKVVSVSGNPCSVSFSLSSPASAAADFFAPVFFYIPVGTMQDNQILTQSQSLQNYSLTCTTPATAAPPSGCVPVAAVPTLDQVLNPVASKTFSIGANTPLIFTDPGIFTSASENDDLESIVTGGNSPSTCNILSVIYGGGSTYKFTNAITGLVCVPSGSTGVTNAYSNGVIGAAYVNNSGATGQFGWVGGVGVSGQGWCAVSNARCWGMNAGTSDFSGNTGNVMIGNELDMTSNNNSTTGYAALASYRGNGQASADGFPAYAIIAGAGTGNFTSGFNCNQGSIAGSGTTFTNGCFVAGPRSATGPVSSYTAYFTARNSSNAAVSYQFFSTVDGFGNPEMTTASAASTFQIGKLNIAATFTVSTLPSATTAGAGTAVIVTDATTFTPGTCTGGGADTMLAISNGTSWSCH